MRVPSVGIGLIARAGGAEQHIQKVAGIAEFAIGIDEGHAPANGDRRRPPWWHLADEAVDLEFAGLGAENIFGVVIEGGKSGDGGDQHAHWDGRHSGSRRGIS